MRGHAIHEASHAVVAWFLGAKIHKLTIVGPKLESRGGTPWYCEFQHPGMVRLDSLSPEDINLRFMVNLAPYGLSPEKSSLGATADVIEAMSFLAWHRKHQKMAEKAAALLGNDDPARIDSEEDYLAHYGGPASEFFKQFGQPVVNLLKNENISNCIERLADKLVKQGRVTGFEAAQLLEKTWKGPLPEKAKPAQEHPAGVSLSSPENAVESARGLIRMALGILRGVDDFETVEKPTRAILQCMFQLEEYSARNS